MPLEYQPGFGNVYVAGSPRTRRAALGLTGGGQTNDVESRRQAMIRLGAPAGLVNAGVFDDMDPRAAAIAGQEFSEAEEARIRNQKSWNQALQTAQQQFAGKDPELLREATARIREMSIHPEAITDALKNAMHDAEIERQRAAQQSEMRAAEGVAARKGEGVGGRTVQAMRERAGQQRLGALRDIDLQLGQYGLGAQQQYLGQLAQLGLGQAQRQQRAGERLINLFEDVEYQAPSYQGLYDVAGGSAGGALGGTRNVVSARTSRSQRPLTGMSLTYPLGYGTTAMQRGRAASAPAWQRATPPAGAYVNYPREPGLRKLRIQEG